MEKKPRVSVLIPVYNTQNYLEECLESILNQSLQDIEILVMDDGSTDGSRELIEGYCTDDSRVHLFSQENSGQSVARNRLIDMAKGDYIYFMDSDDILDKEALASCYDLAERERLDIVTFDAGIIYEGDMKPLSYNYIRNGLIPLDILSGESFFRLTVENGSYRAAPWLLFVRKGLLESVSVRFYPGIIHEDELFTPKLYLIAKRVSYLPKIFFTRRVRASSTMTKSFSERNFSGYCTVVKELNVFSRELSLQNRVTVKKIITDITSVLAYNSDSLNYSKKLRLAKFIVKEGLLHDMKTRDIAILIFPFLKRAKSIIKRGVGQFT